MSRIILPGSARSRLPDVLFFARKMKKSKRSYCSKLGRLLKRYLANSSIHGLKYLVQDGRHWSERVFWLICCGLSWWGCTTMVLGVLTDYSNRPVATTIETNYLEWHASLPSLHFCALVVPETKNYSSAIWSADPNTLGNIMDINGWGLYKKLKSSLDSKTFEQLASLGVMNCELMFDRCEWNEKPLNCCEVILPLWTPVGHCLSFNSIHTMSGSDPPRFIKTGADSGIFSFFLKTGKYNVVIMKRINLYLLDRLELPSVLSSVEKNLPHKWKRNEMDVNIVQEPTFNEDGVREVAIEKRHCRFPDEAEELQIFKRYSYDACLAEDMTRRMLEYCGCVTHIFPRTPKMPVCNQEGLECLVQNTPNLTDTTEVTCAADCEETRFDFFADSLAGSAAPKLHLNLMYGPTVRYRRYIVHSKLDLVVAVGSAVGLFVGASILSLVEIPYWFIVRGIDNDNENDD